jgi:SAM-dependent methyltransferase
MRLVARTARAITNVGERRNNQRLIYNPVMFLFFFLQSISDAPGVIEAIERLFPDASRFLDVGAGSGGFAAQVRRTGRQVVACEYNSTGRWFSRRLGVDSQHFDLAQADPAPGITGSFDIAYSFEVAEHLPADIGDKLVAFMARQAPVVIFTAAQPGQTGAGHINEQPPEYWVDRFAVQGMTLDQGMTERLREEFVRAEVAGWFSRNVLVLRQS